MKPVLAVFSAVAFGLLLGACDDSPTATSVYDVTHSDARNAIWVQGANGLEDITSANDLASVDRAQDPAISPDGTRLVLSASPTAGGGDRDLDLIVVDVDGNNLSRLATRSTCETVLKDAFGDVVPAATDCRWVEPDWSENDRIVAILDIAFRESRAKHIVVFDVGGNSDPALVPIDPGMEPMNPSWNPDGDTIAFEDLNTAIYTVDTAGGGTCRVTAPGSRSGGNNPLWRIGRTAQNLTEIVYMLAGKIYLATETGTPCMWQTKPVPDMAGSGQDRLPFAGVPVEVNGSFFFWFIRGDVDSCFADSSPQFRGCQPHNIPDVRRINAVDVYYG